MQLTDSCKLAELIKSMHSVTVSDGASGGLVTGGKSAGKGGRDKMILPILMTTTVLRPAATFEPRDTLATIDAAELHAARSLPRWQLFDAHQVTDRETRSCHHLCSL